MSSITFIAIANSTAMPSPTREQVDAVIEYVNDHYEELVEEDRRVEERIKQGVADRKPGGSATKLTTRSPWRKEPNDSRINCAGDWRSKRRKTLGTLLCSGVMRIR
jgi:hypothetical protein